MSALESKALRMGNRYYEVAEGYDKRVYENDPINYVYIILALFTFWTFNALHWWAVFEFGIYASTEFTLYSIIIFVATVTFGSFMLISGASSNKIKRRHEFYKEEIEAQKAKKHEEKERKKQEDEYKEKIKL